MTAATGHVRHPPERSGGFVALRRWWSGHPPVSLLPPAIAAIALTVGPLWYLVDRAFGEGAAAVSEEILQRRTLDLVTRSIVLAGTVTALCVVLGVAAAWLVVRSDLPGRRVLGVLLALPFAVPSYLAAFAWVSWRPSLAGFRGAVLVLVLVSYPYVYLPVAAALRRLDPAQEEVARSLGRGSLDVSIRLTLRQVRPTIVAGALLVALYVLSDFGAVATMRYEAFTWVIYGAYRAGFDPSRAAILSLVLVVAALVLVVLEARARGRAESSRIGAGAARGPRPVALGRARTPAFALVVGLLAAGLAFPVGRIVQWVVTFESTDVDVGDVAAALGSTLRLAALAAVAASLLAFPLGVLVARHRRWSTSAVERATYVSHALPGIVMAIAFVYLGVRVARPVYQETPLLVAAYVALYLPLAVGAVRTSIEQSPVRLEEVARSLGARHARVLTRVTVPLAAPGIAAGAALVFLSTMKELPATLVLRPTSTHTLATELWRFTSVSDYANAGPYALALVLFAAIPTALLSGVLIRRRDDATPPT